MWLGVLEVPGQGGRLALGLLLVQRGLLDEEQLAVALAEHERSRAPLGQALVDLGFVSAPVVAQALATQHGGTLKTEYGVAVGFDAESGAVAVKQPPVTSSVGSQLAPVVPVSGRLRLADAALAAVASEAAPVALAEAAPAVVAAVAGEGAAASEHAELSAPLAPVQNSQQAEQMHAVAAEWDRTRVEVGVLVEERDAARAEVDAALAEAQRLAAERESAHAQVTALRSRITMLEALADRLRAEMQAATARQETLEHDLSLARGERDSAQAENQRRRVAITAADERVRLLRRRVEAALAEVCRQRREHGGLSESAQQLVTLVADQTNGNVEPPLPIAVEEARDPLRDREYAAADESSERHLSLVRLPAEALDA
jgi:hypothetical protein